MHVHQERTATRYNQAGLAINQIHCWPMRPTPSIATGREPRLQEALVNLGAQPCWSLWIQVSVFFLYNSTNYQPQYIHIYIVFIAADHHTLYVYGINVTGYNGCHFIFY